MIIIIKRKLFEALLSKSEDKGISLISIFSIQSVHLAHLNIFTLFIIIIRIYMIVVIKLLIDCLSKKAEFIKFIEVFILSAI